jgi:hypothetical protein
MIIFIQLVLISSRWDAHDSRILTFKIEEKNKGRLPFFFIDLWLVSSSLKFNTFYPKTIISSLLRK